MTQLMLELEQVFQQAVSAQFFNEGVSDAGAIGREVFQFVLAHAQELPFADGVLVASDLALELCPTWLFLAVLQFAHHQALRIDLAGTFLAMGGHLEGDGAGDPGADAAGEFGIPAVTRRGFAAVRVAVFAQHGWSWGRAGMWAFAWGDGAGLGVVECAAVGKGLGHLACNLAADGGVFAGADLGLCRRGGPQDRCKQGAAQNKGKARRFFHARAGKVWLASLRSLNALATLNLILL